MKIGFGSDHGGYDLKLKIMEALSKEEGYELFDYGSFEGERVDYPDYAKKTADAVVNKEVDLGILFCGTGIGISLAANKVKGIRAAVCSEPYSAKLSKEHNNSNIIAFGALLLPVSHTFFPGAP